jgi:hypothetical protein
LKREVLEVKLFFHAERNFLSHFVKLDTKIVDFFHSFRLQLIETTKLFNF